MNQLYRYVIKLQQDDRLIYSIRILNASYTSIGDISIRFREPRASWLHIGPKVLDRPPSLLSSQNQHTTTNTHNILNFDYDMIYIFIGTYSIDISGTTFDINGIYTTNIKFKPFLFSRAIPGGVAFLGIYSLANYFTFIPPEDSCGLILSLSPLQVCL